MHMRGKTICEFTVIIKWGRFSVMRSILGHEVDSRSLGTNMPFWPSVMTESLCWMSRQIARGGLHANSTCRLDRIMHKFFCHWKVSLKVRYDFVKKLKDIWILKVRACAWMSVWDSRYVRLYMYGTTSTGRIILVAATWLVGLWLTGTWDPVDWKKQVLDLQR